MMGNRSCDTMLMQMVMVMVQRAAPCRSQLAVKVVDSGHDHGNAGEHEDGWGDGTRGCRNCGGDG
jgi:hypothetical protein